MKRATKRAVDSRPQHWLDLVICLALLLATLAIYAQVRQFDFVNYDDPHHVSQNPHVRDGLNSAGLKWALLSGESANWFPVTRISYLADRQFLDLDPGSIHLVNLLFHTLSTLLLYGFLRSATGSRWRSGFVAAIFALHPLHVESVAWVSERKDVLSAFFWFATLLAYLRYTRRPSIGRYLLVVVWFCLGVMSKPVVVTLPLALLLLDVWPLGRISLTTPKAALLWEKLPLVALSAVSSGVTYAVQSRAGAVSAWDAVPLVSRIANAVVSYVTYILEFLWPARLAVFYPFTEALPVWRIAAAAVVLLSVTFLALRYRANRPWFLLGWFWYLGTMVPMAGLVQVGAAAHADRYTYLPGVGLTILMAWGGAELIEWRPRAKPAVAALAAAACAACLVLAFLQIRYWENSITLFQHAIQVTTGNWVAYNNLGAALRNQGRIDDAEANFQQALAFRPGFVDALVNLGEAYNSQGRFDEGARYCLRALAINPVSVEALDDLGSALGSMGKPAEAEMRFREALRLRADDPKSHNDLGLSLAAQGRVPEAIGEFQAALHFDPDYANAEFNLGVSLANTGRLAESVIHFSTALRIHPDDQRARQTLETVSARLREQKGQ